jgi:beta-phosphoglucomutase
MAIRAFIFDLDGVLTDTAEHHYRAWKQLADEEGIPFTRQDNEALRGVSRQESLNLLLKGRRISPQQAQEWMDRKNRYYLERIRQITPQELLPGAREILGELRAAGLKIAIASASRNAAQVVNRLELRPQIDVLVDGNSVERTKPAPDLFLLAARLLGEAPENCVVVEDAAAGIAAARAAGMRCIGLGPVEQVGAADLVLPGLEGVRLRELLERLS